MSVIVAGAYLDLFFRLLVYFLCVWSVKRIKEGGGGGGECE